MRVALLVALFVSFIFQSPEPSRLRMFFRDAFDTGIPQATLILRTETNETVTLRTDDSGIALSNAVPGAVVYLVGGQLMGGEQLVADSYPPDQGFRLVLIPNATRDVLLRLDGNRIVLDPEMLFSPGEPGEPVVVPSALVATVPPMVERPTPQAIPSIMAPQQVPTIMPLPQPTQPAPTPAESRASIIWWVLGIGSVALLVAFMIGLVRRRSL
jgi:hypothetical protein